MIWLLFFSISLLASVAGSICGIGGGIIIKPALDATKLLPVDAISFLSGCTVLSMSTISVWKTFCTRAEKLNLHTSSFMAVGAAIGGVAGKELFQYTFILCPDERLVGAIQAFVLMLVTILTLLYTVCKDRIRTHCIRHTGSIFVAGLFLGILSSFLGIGGGPVNLLVLHYLFSMETKTAALHSLYIIMFSQISSLCSTLIQRAVPDISLFLLVLMILGGSLGGLIGNRINRKISSQKVNDLFLFMIIAIILICLYNFLSFLV